jgi:hypothetical protein
MPAEFDPYHRWLGIRPEDQPVADYRMLDPSRLEDDPEVVREAGGGQIGRD